MVAQPFVYILIIIVVSLGVCGGTLALAKVFGMSGGGGSNTNGGSTTFCDYSMAEVVHFSCSFNPQGYHDTMGSRTQEGLVLIVHCLHPSITNLRSHRRGLWGA